MLVWVDRSIPGEGSGVESASALCLGHGPGLCAWVVKRGRSTSHRQTMLRVVTADCLEIMMGALGNRIWMLARSDLTYASSRSIDVIIFPIRILRVISVIVILGGVLRLLSLGTIIPLRGPLHCVVVLLLELAIWPKDASSTVSTPVQPSTEIHTGYTSSISIFTFIQVLLSHMLHHFWLFRTALKPLLAPIIALRMLLPGLLGECARSLHQSTKEFAIIRINLLLASLHLWSLCNDHFARLLEVLATIESFRLLFDRHHPALARWYELLNRRMGHESFRRLRIALEVFRPSLVEHNWLLAWCAQSYTLGFLSLNAECFDIFKIRIFFGWCSFFGGVQVLVGALKHENIHKNINDKE